MLIVLFIGVFAATWVLTRRRSEGRVKALLLCITALVLLRVTFEVFPAPIVALALAGFIAAVVEGSRRAERRRLPRGR